MIAVTPNTGKVIRLFLTISLALFLFIGVGAAADHVIVGLPDVDTVDEGDRLELSLFNVSSGEKITTGKIDSSDISVGEVVLKSSRWYFYAYSAGTTTLTYEDVSVTVTVQAVPLTIDKVTIIPENTEIIQGTSAVTLTAKAWNTTKNRELPASFSWDVNGKSVESSSSTYVFSSSTDSGRYTLNASVNGITGTAVVTVKEPTLSLQLTMLSGSIIPAPSQQFTLRVTESNELGTVSVADSAINWTISNDGIQKIGETRNGVQTFEAVKAGATKITAEVNGISATLDITTSLGPEKPQFNIVIENPYCDNNLPVKFTIEQTGNAEINSISWKLYENKGEGNVQIAESSDKAYSLSITTPGTYVIEAEATNTKTGLTGFVRKEFTITKKPDVVIPNINTNTLTYQKINPGTGTFTYTTTYNNGAYEVSKSTVFGVIYASSLSIGTYGHGPNIEVVSINGKETIPGGNGWMYMVNGVQPGSYPNNYLVSNGDKIIFWYSESMSSTPETSTLKYAFEVDTSLAAPVVLPTEIPETNTTNVTHVVLPPAEKVIPETKPIENTTGLVVLEKTEIVKQIQVPVEILTENPNASVKVVEGNTEEVKLPSNVTAEHVHLILEVSVVDKEGDKISVDKPGHFILDAEVPAGKQILVGHFNETAGIWENCPVEQLPNGQWKVTYYSLSPFSVLFLDKGKENPFVIIEAQKEPEQTETDTTNETKPGETPTDEAKSPLATAWLIPGIFALGAGLKRRNN